MMRQGRRLGVLAVRVVRHHRLDVLLGEIEQCRAIVIQVIGDLQQAGANREPAARCRPKSQELRPAWM